MVTVGLKTWAVNPIVGWGLLTPRKSPRDLPSLDMESVLAHWDARGHRRHMHTSSRNRFELTGLTIPWQPLYRTPCTVRYRLHHVTMSSPYPRWQPNCTHPGHIKIRLNISSVQIYATYRRILFIYFPIEVFGVTQCRPCNRCLLCWWHRSPPGSAALWVCIHQAVCHSRHNAHYQSFLSLSHCA